MLLRYKLASKAIDKARPRDLPELMTAINAPDTPPARPPGPLAAILHRAMSAHRDPPATP